MAPDAPEREPEMQDTPPCQCPNYRECRLALTVFLFGVQVGHQKENRPQSGGGSA